VHSKSSESSEFPGQCKRFMINPTRHKTLERLLHSAVCLRYLSCSWSILKVLISKSERQPKLVFLFCPKPKECNRRFVFDEIWSYSNEASRILKNFNQQSGSRVQRNSCRSQIKGWMADLKYKRKWRSFTFTGTGSSANLHFGLRIPERP
jgi:hypothetical protein